MNLILSNTVADDNELVAAGHVFLGAAYIEPPVEVHVFWASREKLPRGGTLTSDQAAEVLAWLKASLDLDSIDSVEFLRKYVEVLDDAYRQQAAFLQMSKDENQEIWKSNERISREMTSEIARLEAELAEAKRLAGTLPIDRSHEECCDCKLLHVEPPQCKGHVAGPSSCPESQPTEEI